jgi:hypothetical protein
LEVYIYISEGKIKIDSKDDISCQTFLFSSNQGSETKQKVVVIIYNKRYVEKKRGRKQQLFVTSGRIVGKRLAGEIEP